jgi:predicted DCC family thiol-disulfide oxidoreductase YuxK
MNGVLVYDGDCGFCTTSARWLGGQGRGRVQIVPWQNANLASMDLTEEQCSAAVQWHDTRGTVSGDRAIARALMASGGWRRPIGMLMSIPPARWIGPSAYKLVAKNRHRLPGATDACRINQH